MIRSSVVGSIVAAFAFVGVSATLASAQNARSWVSGTGTDANPCTRTQPCRTFAGALAKTLPDGEIDALDPGEFGPGPVSITKSITIDGGAGVAGIFWRVPITISAGANDVVVLRNLSLTDGTGGGAVGDKGIEIIGGRSVLIENCSISGFSSGISFTPVGGMTVTIRNTTIQGTGLGIYVSGLLGAFYARLTADHVRLENNGTGILAQDNSLVFVRDSIASDSFFSGFYAKSSAGGAVELDLENTSSSHNGNAGIVSENVGAVVRISNSMIDHNVGAGVVPLAGGLTLSYGNNKIAGNAGGDGTMTSTAQPK